MTLKGVLKSSLKIGLVVASAWAAVWVGVEAYKMFSGPTVTVTETITVVQPAMIKGRMPTLWSESSVAHGCPISPTIAYTAKHVAMAHWNEDGEAPQNLVWGDAFGNSGVVSTISVGVERDVAVVQHVRHDEFVHYFPISKVPAKAGDEIFAVGYDYEDYANQKLYEGKVVRIQGSAVIIDVQTQAGSSGGCLLKKDGTVVGIVTAMVGNAGIAQSVIGKWAPYFKEEK
jgi:hypothetical protein